MDEAGKHSANHRGCQWLHHFGPGLRAPHDGDQARDDGGYGHDFGTQPQESSFFYGIQQIIVVKILTTLETFLFQGFLQIGDHHNAGLNGCSKKGNVSDPYCDTEMIAKQPL